MNSTLTQSHLVQEELEQILDNLPATLQTLKALEIVQHNFAGLSQTHLQVKGFIQKALPQFEQYQKDFVEMGKRVETQREQAILLNSQLTQKQQDVEREVRINHENRWGELRQKFVELQNRMESDLDQYQKQATTWDRQLTQKQQDIERELRINHENRWAESREKLIDFQSKVESVLDTYQKQATVLGSQLTQKQQEIEKELRTNHEKRWNQAQQELIETQNRVKYLTDVNNTLQRRLRRVTLLTWLAFLSTFGMIAWLLYPLYQPWIQWLINFLIVSYPL